MYFQILGVKKRATEPLILGTHQSSVVQCKPIQSEIGNVRFEFNLLRSLIGYCYSSV